MAKLSYIWFANWRRHATLDLSSNLIPRKVSSVTVMPISLEIGTRRSQQWTPVLLSHSGWIIFYAQCPVSWASKLQLQVALSTTEAEYIAMSQSLRDAIPVMNLLQEMGARLPSHLYQISRVLQGIWRQLRSSGTRKASQAMSKDQAHKCLLSSFL